MHTPTFLGVLLVYFGADKLIAFVVRCFAEQRHSQRCREVPDEEPRQSARWQLARRHPLRGHGVCSCVSSCNHRCVVVLPRRTPRVPEIVAVAERSDLPTISSTVTVPALVDAIRAMKAGGRTSMLLALQTRLEDNAATKPYMSASMSRSLAEELMAVLDRDALSEKCITTG